MSSNIHSPRSSIYHMKCGFSFLFFFLCFRKQISCFFVVAFFFVHHRRHLSLAHEHASHSLIPGTYSRRVEKRYGEKRRENFNVHATTAFSQKLDMRRVCYAEREWKKGWKTTDQWKKFCFIFWPLAHYFQWFNGSIQTGGMAQVGSLVDVDVFFRKFSNLTCCNLRKIL